MATDPFPDKPLPWLAAFALTALCYGIAGIAALPLAIPPGYSTPLYPAAGVAVASVLIFGWRMLPAIALGSLCVNLSVALGRGPFHLGILPVPLAIALGATGQAWLNGVLVKRYVQQPLTLSEPRDIGAFLVAGIVACLVNPCVANLALYLAGTVPASELPFSLSTWWIGDLLGVLIAAPVILSLIGRPRDAWRPRRLSVGLTLSLVTLLLAFGIRQVVQWNAERVQTAFDHDAANAVQALRAQLREPQQALEALNGVFIASDDVNAEEMHLATRAWLVPGRLQAMAWSDLVPRADLPAYEVAVRTRPGMEAFKVFDRAAPGAARPAATTGDAVVVRYIEPLATNAGAVGVNVMSIPATRAAIERARRTGEPAATAGFRLTQQAANESQLGVVLYQAVYLPRVPRADQRMAATRGTVSVVLRMDDQLQALSSQLPAYLSLCLLDVTPGAPAQRLAGPAGCETRSARLQLVSAMPYAGRQWEVHVLPELGALPRVHSADVWLFALVGLLSTAMLGAFLLTVTGRTRRIESAVRERTAALQAEVHEREVAEAALRESEQRFRNILNNVPIGVIYTDLQGKAKQTNPRFCELTGYSAEELLHLSLADYTHPEDMVQDTELMEQLVRGEIPMYRRHKRYIAKSGKIVWVQATVSLLRDADAKPRSIVGVVEDITDELRLEEAEHAREAAEASNRAKSDFLSRMSHELRTPLNAMLGFAQLLELDPRHPLAEAQRPWVTQIQQAGWHLLEMINDVLDLSRIESGNLRLQTETLNLAELLEATLGMVEGQAQQNGIAITRELGPGTATVMGRRHPRQADPDQPAEQRGQIQHRERPHPHRRAPAGQRRGRDRGHRHRAGDDGRPARRAVPALQPPRTRTLDAAGHRHRPGDQPAPGRADGRYLARTQRRGRGVGLHPDPALLHRSRHGAHRPRRPAARDRRLPPAPGALRRGQRDQCRGDARHPGAAAAGRDAGVHHRPRWPGRDPRPQAGPDPARHAPARHQRHGAAAPPQERSTDRRRADRRRLGGRARPADRRGVRGGCHPLPDQAGQCRGVVDGGRRVAGTDRDAVRLSYS